MRTRQLFTLVLFLIIAGCTQMPPQLPLIDTTTFGGETDGKKVELFTLKNSSGIVAQITNYGGRVVSLWVPDRNGKFEDVVLGFPTLEGYQKTSEPYFGALIGRYGNRIARGEFMLNDSLYRLATNNGLNHLHGGIKGFNNVVWDAIQSDDKTLLLSYFSADGEEGYPGNLQVNVTYELTDDNELKIEYKAITDKTTPVNLTHHSFFNLKGAGNGDATDHLLQINAAYYTPIDSGLIPTGVLEPVEGTPFDFRTPTAIGARVNEENQQLKLGRGYDHNWVLLPSDSLLCFAARVVEPASGRTMEVYTNEPGIQFYGGNFLTGNDTVKYGKVYPFRGSLCLETQHFPDSVNKPTWPTVVLNPGETYRHHTVHKFSVK